jgi:hypothetical protein
LLPQNVRGVEKFRSGLSSGNSDTYNVWLSIRRAERGSSFAQPKNEGSGSIRIERRDDAESCAGQPCNDNIVRYRSTQGVGHRDDRAVSGGMPVHVVDLAEAGDVENDHDGGLSSASGQPGGERAWIGQSC